MKAFYYFLALIGGIALSMEGAIGSELGGTIGELESSFYIFAIGSVLFGLILLFFGQGSLLKMSEVPRWQLLGGFFGITYLTIIFISVPYIGVGTAMLAVIIGQMIASIVIEHFGWLGSKRFRINKERILSILCMIIALVLVF